MEAFLYDKVTLLAEGDVALLEIHHLLESLFGPLPQDRGRCARVGAAEQVNGFFDGLDGAGADIGYLGHAGEFEGVEQVGFGLHGVRWDDPADQETPALPLLGLRDEPEFLGGAAGQFLKRSPVDRMRPQNLATFPASYPLLVARKTVLDPESGAV